MDLNEKNSHMIRVIIGDPQGLRWDNDALSTSWERALSVALRFLSQEALENELLSPILCLGAAGFALQSRAAAITEVFGKRPEDSAFLLRQAEKLLDRFESILIDYSIIGVHDDGPLPNGKGFTP